MDREPGEEAGWGSWPEARGGGGLPFVAQEHIVEVVVDDEQLLSELLIGDSGDELQDPLLHGSARPVELLRREQERWPRPWGPRARPWPGAGLQPLCHLGRQGFPNRLQAPQDSCWGSTNTLWIPPPVSYANTEHMGDKPHTRPCSWLNLAVCRPPAASYLCSGEKPTVSVVGGTHRNFSG